ncbi:tol-pal system YbgF family protein [Pendulispora albinea]|uniref:Tetratricopeptide repeat protein n=1 Tax=Pendulispora albinea TaxID=2741071 RepID=A0ABZ2LZZ3_9BACT
MSDLCPQHFDANHVASALRGELDAPDFHEHLKTCTSCQETAQVIQSAQRAWRSAALEDDERARAASEQRLVRAWARPRPTFGWRSALVGAAIASLLVLRFGPRWPDAAPTGALPSASVLPSALAPSAVASIAPVAPSAPSASTSRYRHSVLVMRDCPACTRSGVPGNSALDAAVDVPRGASLMLSWAMPDDATDVASSMEVTGPARVVGLAGEKADTQAVRIERGHAQMRTSGEAEVQSPHAKMRAVPEIASTWHFDVTAGRTSIVVESGLVAVQSNERNAPLVRLQAGQTAEIRSGGEIVIPPVPSASPSSPSGPSSASPSTSKSASATNPSMPASAAIGPAAPSNAPSTTPAPSASAEEGSNDAAVWQAVQSALHAGDRSGAETKARALMLSARSPAYRDKATFTVGELELARGDVATAQGRLSSLVTTARDPALTSDAMFLLARSYPSPKDRANAWARFLTTSPASPYREQALLEQGRALADAGDMDGARRIVVALKQSGRLPEVIARGVTALEARTNR